jgi:hypothetical protein
LIDSYGESEASENPIDSAVSTNVATLAHSHNTNISDEDINVRPISSAFEKSTVYSADTLESAELDLDDGDGEFDGEGAGLEEDWQDDDGTSHSNPDLEYEMETDFLV